MQIFIEKALFVNNHGILQDNGIGVCQNMRETEPIFTDKVGR